MRKLLAALSLAALLAACTPAANVARDILERADGATLAYVEDGLGFDPGASAALGVILIVIGDDLVLWEAPAQAVCAIEADVMDCRLGDVTGPVGVKVSGTNLAASATFRRPGASAVYQVFGN